MRVRRRSSQRDRGAVALMVSVSLIALFGFVALSVDIGNAWQNRRHLVSATDAAALAAVQEYALDGNGCGGTASTYVSANKANATLTTCSPSVDAAANGSHGDVMVKTQTSVDYAFAPLVGVDSRTLSATAIARYGIPSSVGGLRPFGLCYDALMANPVFSTWLLDTSQPSVNTVTIEYNKDNPSDCNMGDPVPGNWATMDLDGGGNSNSDIQNWTANGFDGLVSAGAIPGDTGAFSPSLSTELQALMDTHYVFPIPLFDSASGNGSNAVFNIKNFVTVEIEGFNTSGTQEMRSLTLRFHAAIVEGVCCLAGGEDLGNYVVQLCAVDENERSDCAITAAP